MGRRVGVMLEKYEEEEGSVMIPKVVGGYMGNKEVMKG